MRIAITVGVIACLAITATALLTNREKPQGYTFEQYVVDFEKTYSSGEEYASRRAIFLRNIADIINHNGDASQTYKKGVNQFTDYSPAQLKQFFGYNEQIATAARSNARIADIAPIDVKDLPSAVDWRDKGVVSPVKNQGGCGSCWAFAGTEAIETAVAQATGKVLALSTQNVVSCALNPHHCGGTGGCNGATADIAYGYVADRGIASEADYPYRARTGTCNETIAKTAKIGGFVKIAENNYTQLITALATVGPLAVNVDASIWSSYSSGVFTGCPFNEVDINHVVQVVGYGHDDAKNKDYWIARNSWGAVWGEKGYMRLERHSDGGQSWCSPDHKPSDGTGCDGGPSVITVCGSCGIWYDASYATGGSIL
jgi:cathepsin L